MRWLYNIFLWDKNRTFLLPNMVDTIEKNILKQAVLTEKREDKESGKTTDATIGERSTNGRNQGVE